LAGGVKKWFMFQVWRIQQVAAVLTIVLLALNLSLMMWGETKWWGGVFQNSYTAIPVFMVTLLVVIWLFSIFWDLKMKMWREQMAIAMERNPYSKEKMYAKEISGYALFWLPVLDHLGKTDPDAKASADALRVWIKKALSEDPAAQQEWKELLNYIEKYPDNLNELHK
jgi:hypothetical protein